MDFFTVANMFRKNQIADVNPEKPTMMSNTLSEGDFLGVFRIWDLIRENNCEELFKCINALDVNEKEEILNGKFVDITEKVGKKELFLSFFITKKENLNQESRPLFQAIMFGSFDCVCTLINSGADILQQERHGWNVIHYLIVVSFCSLDYEPKAVKIYKQLLKNLQRYQIRSLLLMEDKEGFRPLELAVHAGCLGLAKAILNTEGVYLIKLERRGLEEKAWYDVTDYESPFTCKSRRSKNPLNFLTQLDRKVLKNPKALYELRHGILRQWAEVKFYSNMLPIMLWFLQRTICFVAFYCIVALDMGKFISDFYIYFGYYNPTGSNSTIEANETNSNVTNETVCTPFKSWYFAQNNDTSFLVVLNFFSILVINIFFVLTWDFFGCFMSLFTKSGKRDTCFGRKKNLAVDTFFHEVSQTFFMATTLTYILQLFLLYSGQLEGSYLIVKLCLIVSCYLSVWSILYFVQLLPSVGHFINIIQKMQIILLNFAVVYFILMFPFPHVFLALLKGYDNCELEGFEDLLAGFYSVFKLMLNMLDFGMTYGNTGKSMLFSHLIHKMCKM